MIGGPCLFCIIMIKWTRLIYHNQTEYRIYSVFLGNTKPEINLHSTPRQNRADIKQFWKAILEKFFFTLKKMGRNPYFHLHTTYEHRHIPMYKSLLMRFGFIRFSLIRILKLRYLVFWYVIRFDRPLNYRHMMSHIKTSQKFLKGMSFQKQT